jgi:hypothetical protein
MEECGVFLICDSLFECGIGVRWGGVVLEFLAVTTRNSRNTAGGAGRA